MIQKSYQQSKKVINNNIFRLTIILKIYQRYFSDHQSKNLSPINFLIDNS
jgi:hypothetical protein